MSDFGCLRERRKHTMEAAGVRYVMSDLRPTGARMA